VPVTIRGGAVPARGQSTYHLTATYQGSQVYATSASAKKTRTVTK
jgi:hypothetical protein